MGDEVISGMNTAVNTLATTVSGDALWGVFNSAVPYIAVVVLARFPAFT